MKHKLPDNWELLPMREKIEHLVIRNFKNGCPELCYWEGKRMSPFDDNYEPNPDFSIYEYVKNSTDSQLLSDLNQQACYRYR